MAEQNFTSGHCFDCLLRCAEMSTFDRRQEKNMQSQTLQNTDEHKSGLFVYLFLFYPLFASKTFQTCNTLFLRIDFGIKKRILGDKVFSAFTLVAFVVSAGAQVLNVWL